jgi:hypothetical protein
MKTCNDVTEKILNGFENDPEVMAHLADCPECKELAENAKQIRLKPGMMTPPPALDMEIHNMAVVAAESRKERPLYFRRAIIRVSAAAVLALCACVLGVLHTPSKKVEKGVVAAQKKTASAAVVDYSYYTMEDEKELLSLSMEIQGTAELFTQVANSGSRFLY